MSANQNYETTCDPITGVCTSKLRVSRRSAYEIPEARQGSWVHERVKNSPSHEYLGYGLNIVKREVDLAGRTVLFTASTPQVDRYGDVILQDGWETRNFAANPIILFAHDSRALPIGKAVKFGVGPDGNLNVLVEFSKIVGSYDLPEIVLQLVAQGMLNCVSVGFIPLEFEWRFEKDAEGNQLPFPSGRTYKKCELLEVSVVPVPANPGAVVIGNSFTAHEKAFRAIEDVSDEAITASDVERSYFVFDAKDGVVYEHGSRNPVDAKENAGIQAWPALLVKMYKDGQSRPFVLKDTTPSAARLAAIRAMERDSFSSQGFLCELAGYDSNEFPVYRSVKLLAREKVLESQNSKEQEKNKMSQGCKCNNDAPNAEQKSVVPFKHYKLAPANAPWDAGKEMGSTDKPADWKAMSTIVLNDGKNKGDYKLPHHKGPESDFATVKRGVAAALGRSNQVKGASDADKKGARAHLVKHMAEFQKADGKDFNEEAFERNLEALEEMRDSMVEGSDNQESVIRAIELFAENPMAQKSLDAVGFAHAWKNESVRDDIVKIFAGLFPVEERKFSNETMNKKMQRAHKSMSSAKDELHSVHDDAMDMLGQACDMVESMFKPAADGSKAADHLGEETVASNLGKAYDMAYEAKQMVRRSASRYADHMQDAVERLDALVEYVGKKEKEPSGDGGKKPQSQDPQPGGDGDGDNDDDVKNFLEQASNPETPASNVSQGTEPSESALTAGSAKAKEEDVTDFLLKATTADDHAAH